MIKPVLIGGSSFIGSQILKFSSIDFLTTYNTKKISQGKKFDLLKDKISNVIDLNEYQNFIILSSYTNPEFCEFNKKISDDLNIKYTKLLIDELIYHNKKIIFFSTEYVYSGFKGNYKESDPSEQINRYAQQKFYIENYIVNNAKDFIIFRLAKTYSLIDLWKDFHSQWIKKFILNKEKQISCFSNQIFSPISSIEVALVLETFLKKEINGIFNLGGAESYSRLECLKHFLNKFKIKDVHIDQTLIDAKKLGWNMPENVSMNIDKILELDLPIKSYRTNLNEL